MRKRFKNRIKGTAKMIMFSATCCTVIYASALMIAAKSFLKAQSNPIDL